MAFASGGPNQSAGYLNSFQLLRKYFRMHIMVEKDISYFSKLTSNFSGIINGMIDHIKIHLKTKKLRKSICKFRCNRMFIKDYPFVVSKNHECAGDKKKIIVYIVG